MKDLIKKIILLIIIILFLQLILFIFKTKHNVNYIVVNNKEKIKRILKHMFFLNLSIVILLIPS